MQRFVYTMAKGYHTDDPNKGTANPGGFDKGQSFQNSTNF